MGLEESMVFEMSCAKSVSYIPANKNFFAYPNTRTSVARTLVARFLRLFRTRS